MKISTERRKKAKETQSGSIFRLAQCVRMRTNHRHTLQHTHSSCALCKMKRLLPPARKDFNKLSFASEGIQTLNLNWLGFWNLAVGN